MPNLNQVNIIGHVTRAVEVRYTKSGKAVAEIGVAFNRQWRNDRDEMQKETTFVDVTAWARLAEICAEFVRKGDPIFFSGRLKQESWVDKEQKKCSKLVIVAEQMQLLTRSADRTAEPRKQSNGKHTNTAEGAAQRAQDVFPGSTIVGDVRTEEEIPF